MPQTLGQAAKSVGKNRTTILRAIKAGKLSAHHDEATGAWMIEPAELHRLYAPSDAHASSPRGDAHLRSNGASPAIREFEARLADKDAVIDDLRRRLDEERADRRQTADRLAAAQERIAALLADQRASPRRAWWPWRR